MRSANTAADLYAPAFQVYPPAATQSDVYEDAKGIIQSTVDGYNVVYMVSSSTARISLAASPC
jgi:hypothetical protein